VKKRIRTRNGHACSRASALILAAGFALVATAASAHDPTAPAPPTHEVGKEQAQGSKAIHSTVPPDDICRPGGPCNIDHKHPEHGSLGNIGAKLSDPTSDIWALQFNIQGPVFYDGDLNTGDPELGGNTIFQPVLPIPLYGTGKNAWKMITRPIIPIIFSQPTPTSDGFRQVGGLGDIEIPLLLNLPTSISGNWILGAGPVFEFPTSTNDALGAQQFSIGPAVVAGYKTKSFVAALFPNYFFGVGDRSDRKSTTPTTSKLSLLYSFAYNLPNAWQVGLNPTISYNNKASSGNQWDVPVGLFAAKTIKIGRVPTKIQFGLEYSVVSPDRFGKRAAFRLVVTPVIPGLVQNPIFGGR
jgi:hypothetical protein